MKYYLYNPYSKNNHGYDLFKDRHDLNIIDTTNTVSMNNLCKTIKKEDEIIICGGDGSLNYLINHYSFLYDYPLSYYKNGSGNDLYRSLSTKYQDVRTYIVNDKDIFINNMGVGFDSLVCLKTNQTPNKNKFSYLINAFKSIKEYQTQDITIKYDGLEKAYQNIYLATLANGEYFGGGLKISNRSQLDSDHLELCIATCSSKLKIVFLLIMLKFNKHYYFKKYFKSINVDEVIIKSDNDLLIQLDGEVKTNTKILDVKLYKTIKLRKTTTL